MWPDACSDESIVFSMPLRPDEDGRYFKRFAVYVPRDHPDGLLYEEYRLSTIYLPYRCQAIAVHLGAIREHRFKEKVADLDTAFIAPAHFLDDEWQRAMRSAARRRIVSKLRWLFVLPVLGAIAYTSSEAAHMHASDGRIAIALILTGLYAFLVGAVFRYAERPGMAWSKHRKR